MAELIRLGAYRQGSDPQVDEAIKYNQPIENFLAQGKNERARLEQGYAELADLLGMTYAAGGDAAGSREAGDGTG